MGRRSILGAILCAILSISILPETGHAIPAFARKYKFSCTTCHAPVPRLKEFGLEFAANGFRLPEGQEPPRTYRDTGDPLLELQREFPIAVRFDAWATWESEPNEAWDLKTPWGIKLLSGGAVTPNVGYYFYFYMSEQGEVSGVEDAYLHFNDIGKLPLDIMVGQFQLCDPMMKRELRLTFEDYQIYRVKPGASDANLTYDRGLMLSYDFSFGLGLVGQLVNGNGKPVAGEVAKDFDSDKDKGYGARASYGLGPVTVGYYLYRTREVLSGADSVTTWESSNEVQIHGPDAYLDITESLGLSAQYLHRKDTRPRREEGEIVTEGLVAELVFLPRGPDGRDVLTLLYNKIDSDLQEQRYESFTASVGYLVGRNLRMSLEYTRDFELDGDRLGLGLVAAF